MHTSAVQTLAVMYANEGLRHATSELQHILEEIKAAALLHDAGKLTAENQAILRGEVKSNHLIKHEDAGSLWAGTLGYKYAPQWVYSHHKGLQSRMFSPIWRNRSWMVGKFCSDIPSIAVNRYGLPAGSSSSLETSATGVPAYV